MPGTGRAEAATQGDPIPEEPLRVRVKEDALPRAGSSSEKAVGESGHANLSPGRSGVNGLRKKIPAGQGPRGPGGRAQQALPTPRMERETGFEPATLSLEG